MNLDIEQQGLQVVLHLPQRDKRGPFQWTVSQTLMREVEQDQWRALMHGEPAAIVLKLGNWRGALLELQRCWNIWRDPKEFSEVFPSKETPSQNYDLSPLTFTLGGTVYDDPEKLPAPPDVAYALGTFKLATPTLLVTDPCYNKGTWCTGELQAKTGEWAALVIQRDDFRGHRNAVLLIAHSSLGIRSVVLEELEDSGIHVGVDSGQAGFFEKARYPDDKAQLDYEDGTWYKAACELTLDDDRGNASVAPGRFGAVSQTFWGDGGYPCLVRKDDNGLVIAAAIIFDGSLGSDNEDEDEDDAEQPPAATTPRPLVYDDSLIPQDYSELETMPSGTAGQDDDKVTIDDEPIVLFRRAPDESQEGRAVRIPPSELPGE